MPASPAYIEMDLAYNCFHTAVLVLYLPCLYTSCLTIVAESTDCLFTQLILLYHYLF